MVEERCLEKVSCADIIALSSRDAVSFQFGIAVSLWEVQTGRRNGIVSSADESSQNLPSPFADFPALLQAFNNKDLTLRDLVVLSGAHTIGVAHCNSFRRRLNDHSDKSSLDPIYATILKAQCGILSDDSTFVGMDSGSPLTFDSHYCLVLEQKQGLFVSDAALLTNEKSKKIVNELVEPEKFLIEFAQSMARLIEIGVLTGNEGQIRKTCSVVNS